MPEIITSYVKLVPQRPTTMRFDGWRRETRQIMDNKSKQLKTEEIWVFHVIELDGNKVDLTYSVLSKKHKADLSPLIDSGQLFFRRVTITHYPRDYATEYTLALS